MPIRGGSSVRDLAKRKWTSEDGRKHLAYQLMDGDEFVKGGIWFHGAGSMKARSCVLAIAVLSRRTEIMAVKRV